MKHKLLIIEADNIMRVSLSDSMTLKGYEVLACATGEDGMTAFEEEDFSLVVTDVLLPDINGLDILKRILKKDPQAVILIMTAYGTIKDAVEAMKLGAFDYITKPFPMEEFNLIVDRALELRSLRVENITLNEELIKEGLAWVYVRYCKLPLCVEWQRLQLAAQNQKRGLWGHSGEIPPWEYRRQKKR